MNTEHEKSKTPTHKMFHKQLLPSFFFNKEISLYLHIRSCLITQHFACVLGNNDKQGGKMYYTVVQNINLYHPFKFFCIKFFIFSILIKYIKAFQI